MKRVVTLLLVSHLLLNCQTSKETYSNLIEKASKITQNSKDSARYKEALNLYEKAFKEFSDSIDDTSLYDASIIASKVKDLDKAFNYLKPLAEKEKDEDGYPGWGYVLDEYAEEDYKNLFEDPRWEKLKIKATLDKATFFKKLKEQENEFFAIKEMDFSDIREPEELYLKLENYAPFVNKKQQDYSIAFKVNDTLQTSYFVRLPKKYNPKKKYAMLFVLHGAVRYSSLQLYQIAVQNLEGYHRFYKKHAALNDVILVFPRANKQFNWMFPDDGFFIIPKIVKQIKGAININDNKVFIAGHSNGATGSFSYLMKQPSLFAGAYGFNTYPKVFTGGTFVENILNRSFINFSTDQDYYYPPNANDSMVKLMDSVNADYKDYRYNGFPHWFPEFDESEPAHEILFSDLKKRNRNPFPKKINWEFDDNNYGNIDWLSNIKLDTINQKKQWQKKLNFKINTWLKYNKQDSLVHNNVDKKAFKFPRKSGKILANYRDNIFRIKTSRVSSFKINISPKMVDLGKKIIVYVNDKIYFNKKINYNNIFMLQNFNENKDRNRIFVNAIEIALEHEN